MTPEKVNNKKQAVLLSGKWKLCDGDGAVHDDELCLLHSSGVWSLLQVVQPHVLFGTECLWRLRAALQKLAAWV